MDHISFSCTELAKTKMACWFVKWRVDERVFDDDLSRAVTFLT